MKMKHQTWRNKVFWTFKKGKGKYKDKIHFKCFSYGGVGNFATKCTYKESNDNANNTSKYCNDRYKGKTKHFKRDKYNKRIFIS